jgi:hypothetical protein
LFLKEIYILKSLKKKVKKYKKQFIFNFVLFQFKSKQKIKTTKHNFDFQLQYTTIYLDSLVEHTITNKQLYNEKNKHVNARVITAIN